MKIKPLLWELNVIDLPVAFTLFGYYFIDMQAGENIAIFVSGREDSEKIHTGSLDDCKTACQEHLEILVKQCLI